MTATLAGPELFMRSHEPAWDEARWKELPADGNRYEVIDGVLYLTTALSSFHQWISRQLVSELLPQVDGTGWGMVFYAPIGLFMPGCAPVQPEVLVVRVADRHFFQEGRIRGVPALIVEIESPGSMGYDNRTCRRARHVALGVSKEHGLPRDDRSGLLRLALCHAANHAA